MHIHTQRERDEEAWGSVGRLGVGGGDRLILTVPSVAEQNPDAVRDAWWKY